MKFKQIYNPRKVYEGWFESYFIKPWFRQYADFRGSDSGSDTILSICAWLVITFGVAGILMGLVGLLGPEVGFASMWVVGGIWLVGSLIPFFALLTRAFNGKKAIPRNPKVLGLDILLFCSSALFFLFGLLMMITTINSEYLHPDPGTDESEESAVPRDTVVEEAIFTYQNPEIKETVTEDTLGELNEPDMVDPSESFDPSLEPDAGAAVSVAPPDSIYF